MAKASLINMVKLSLERRQLITPGIYELLIKSLQACELAERANLWWYNDAISRHNNGWY